MSDFSIEKELEKILGDYTEQVGEKTDQILKKVARDTVKELKSSSPKDKGDYAKSWAVKSVKSGRLTSYVVHNKKHYQLTHLLEKGHAKRNGGRVSARVHIKPAETNGIKEAIERLEAEL